MGEGDANVSGVSGTVSTALAAPRRPFLAGVAALAGEAIFDGLTVTLAAALPRLTGTGLRGEASLTGLVAFAPRPRFVDSAFTGESSFSGGSTALTAARPRLAGALTGDASLTGVASVLAGLLTALAARPLLAGAALTGVALTGVALTGDASF